MYENERLNTSNVMLPKIQCIANKEGGVRKNGLLLRAAVSTCSLSMGSELNNTTSFNIRKYGDSRVLLLPRGRT